MFPSQSFVRVTAIALLFVLNFSHAEDLESCELNCSVPFQCECDDLDTNCICIFPGNGSAWGVTKNPNNGNKGFNKDMNASLSGSETSTTSVTSATSTTTATSSSSSVRRKDLTSPRSNTTSISTDYGVIVLFTIPPSSNCHLSSVADFIDAVVNGITTPFVSASGICQDDVISTVEITVSFNTKEIAKEAYTQLAKRSTFAVKGEEYKPKMTAVGFEPNDDKNKKDDTNSETVIIIVVVLVVLFAIFGGVYMMNGVKSMPVVGASTPLVVTNIQIRITTGDMYQDYNLDSVLLRKPSNGRDSWIIWTPSGVVKPTRLQFVIHFDEKSAMNLVCMEDELEFTLHKVVPRSRKNMLWDNLEGTLCNIKWVCTNQNPNIVDFPPTMNITFSSAKAKSESYIMSFKEKVHRIRIKMKTGLSCQNEHEFDVFAGKKKVDFFHVNPSPTSTVSSSGQSMQSDDMATVERLSAIQPPMYVTNMHPQQMVPYEMVPCESGLVSRMNPLFSAPQQMQHWQHVQYQPHYHQHPNYPHPHHQYPNQPPKAASMPGHAFNIANTTFAPSPPSLSEHVNSHSKQALSPYDGSSTSPPSIHNSPVMHDHRVVEPDLEVNPSISSTPTPPVPPSIASPVQHDTSPQMLGSPDQMLGSSDELDPDSPDVNLMLSTQQQPTDNDLMELMNTIDGPEIIEEIVTLMENGNAPTSPELSTEQQVMENEKASNTPELRTGQQVMENETASNTPELRHQVSDSSFLEWLSSDPNLVSQPHT
eukprot:m.227007 g.227007  ORF g.227007 m.227007 type:complete len:761 (+) comp15969_c2_seq5:853-3135(+)